MVMVACSPAINLVTLNDKLAAGLVVSTEFEAEMEVLALESNATPPATTTAPTTPPAPKTPNADVAAVPETAVPAACPVAEPTASVEVTCDN